MTKKKISEAEAARVKAAYDKACAELDAHPEWPRKFVMQRIPKQVAQGMSQIALAKQREAEREMKQLKRRLRETDAKKTYKRKRRK